MSNGTSLRIPKETTFAPERQSPHNSCDPDYAQIDPLWVHVGHDRESVNVEERVIGTSAGGASCW